MSHPFFDYDSFDDDSRFERWAAELDDLARFDASEAAYCDELEAEAEATNSLAPSADQLDWEREVG